MDTLTDENLYTLATISASMNEYERSKALLKLQQRLVAIKNSSRYIANVKAYIPPIEIEVSALRGVEPIIDEDNRLLGSLRKGFKLHYWEDKLYLILRYPISPQPQVSKLFSYAISIELSNEGMQQALAQMESEGKKTLLFAADSKYSFATSNDVKTNEQIQSEVLARAKDLNTEPFSVKLDGRSYMVTFNKSEKLNVILVNFVQEDEIFAKVHTYRWWFWLYSIITFIIILVFCFSTYRFIHKPLIKLVKAFKKVEYGSLSLQINHSKEDEFGYLFDRFNVMVDNLNTLIDQVYKQKIMTQSAEMKHLQSQINPHFLYNSFFILNGMVESEDYDTLKVFTKQLGQYFRFITRSSSNDILLQEEITHAGTYAQIQAKRFRSRIVVNFEELPVEYAQLTVPRLIIQPLIENAFEHGLENKIAKGLLQIRFKGTASGLQIIVEDNGEALTDEKLWRLIASLEQSGHNLERTGMINIHLRLQMKFGPNSGIELARSELGGLKVMMKIGGRILCTDC